MLSNSFRQSFWFVFLPLLIAAGLFWLDELRGYRAELSLFVQPKTEVAIGAAGNLVALSRTIPFASAVYETREGSSVNPLIGETPAKRQAIWTSMVMVQTIGTSDVIRISARGVDSDDAQTLIRATASELVRTASRYYNQKTDIDVRIVSDVVTIPSFTAWPHFLILTVGTAGGFTLLFFLVSHLIDWVFPKSRGRVGEGEYTITSETFKPRIPSYWGVSDDSRLARELSSAMPSARPAMSSTTGLSTETETSLQRDLALDETEPKREPDTVPDQLTEEEIFDMPVSAYQDTSIDEQTDEPPSIEATESGMPETEPLVESNVNEIMEPRYSGYVSHAAAPDNLPIVDDPITPLQGAQARLLKADIDAATALRAAEYEPLVTGIDAPQTHEPTADEYRRRLNELLSGKM